MTVVSILVVLAASLALAGLAALLLLKALFHVIRPGATRQNRLSGASLPFPSQEA
ncbi:MAG: hypothetical protein U5J83_07315 [Bryobacterales bacterium]|nr:hypothetical protein [Bryobacterales bacterium]